MGEGHNLTFLRIEDLFSVKVPCAGKQIFPASKCLTGAGTNFSLFEN